MIRGVLLVLIVTVHLALSSALPADLLPAYHVATRIAGKLAAAGGALWAAGALRGGDYMRRFWIPLGAAYALLTLAEVPISAALAGGEPARAAAIRATLIILGNVLSVAASAVAAYAYRVAGIGLGPSRTATLAWIGFGAVSAAIVGPGFAGDAADALRGGGPVAWASAVGGLCDVATFVLLVPVLRFALRLAGGRLALPWWTFALSSLCWLLFDATAPIAALAGGLETTAASETLRMAACLLTGLAGWFQRDLVAAARREVALASGAR
jgi:hypothetical protein